MYGYAYRYSGRPNFDGGVSFNPATLANTQFYSDPTISTSINAGSPSDTDPVSTLGDLSAAANDGLQATAINQPVWNTTHVTYATNDFINIDAVLTDIATSTQGTIAMWVRPTLGVPVASKRLISFGDTSGASAITVWQDTFGKLAVVCQIGGVNYWLKSTTAAVFSNTTWAYVLMTMDGTTFNIYIDNVLVAQSYVISTNTTKYFNNAPLLDNGTLGTLSFNGGGNIEFWEGDIQQVYISTDAKDAETRTNLYNKKQP